MKFAQTKLIALLLIFFAENVAAGSLEESGWTKTVDDFEGTVNYMVDAKPYSFGCFGGTLAGTFGLVAGEPDAGTPLTMMFAMYGVEDRVSDGDLKWKSSSGNKSISMECQNEYDSGTYNAQCIVTGIDKATASSLINTDFVRFDLPSKNVDLKASEGSANKCANMLKSINRIARDFVGSAS
jgi:hypothetical protein